MIMQLINIKLILYVLLLFLTVGTFIACTANSDNAAQIPKEIKAQVCISGTGLETSLFVRNLNEFTWEAARLSVTKGGQTYLLGLQAEHIDQSRWTTLTIEPDIVNPSKAFEDPSKFTTRAQGVFRDTDLLILKSFDYSKSATIKLDKPFVSEWQGAVESCQ